MIIILFLPKHSDKSKEGWIVFDNFIFGRNLTLVFEFNISS